MKIRKSISKSVSTLAAVATAQLFALMLTSQQAFAAGIGSELSRVGEEASDQVITLISDIMQSAVGPVLIGVSVLFLLFKVVKAFLAHRRNDDIDVMGLIIALVAVIVSTLLTTVRIDSFI